MKLLKDEVQPYFDAVRKLQQILPMIQPENLTAERATEMLATAESALWEDSQEQAARTEYQQILTVLGYQFERETLQQTYEKVKNLITDPHGGSDFSYDLLVSKLNAIDSILANQAFLMDLVWIQFDFMAKLIGRSCICVVRLVSFCPAVRHKAVRW